MAVWGSAAEARREEEMKEEAVRAIHAGRGNALRTVGVDRKVPVSMMAVSVESGHRHRRRRSQKLVLYCYSTFGRDEEVRRRGR